MLADRITGMKLSEALTILARPEPERARPFQVFLATGFTPLHLAPFLKAHIRLAMPDRTPRVQTGLYGDLAGSVEKLRGSDAAAAVILIEWGDLDPRLSLRAAAAWLPDRLADFVDTTRASLA